jgi:hypothetical protein
MRKSAASLAVALLAVAAAPASASEVLVFGDGGLRAANDPALPPRAETDVPLPEPEACGAPATEAPAPPAPPARAAASVRGAVQRALRRRDISRDERDEYLRAYSRARSTRSRLGGRDRRELSAVISTLEGIAARDRLTPSRMPALFLQLRRNTEFWGGTPTFPQRVDSETGPCGGAGGPRSPNGSRILFDGSPMVFQYYAGSGLQLQPLANWGKVNALYTACRRAVHKPERYRCERDKLMQLLDELVATASRRGGFLTWEYWFHFGGGSPPWTSGISQGTAIQALSRAYELLDAPKYLRVARRAVGAFATRYPVGVRARGRGGNHYLLYSFAPGLRVLNGFLQALTGIYDYARIAKDRRAMNLFRSGDRAARREIPRYDTGRWSRYSIGGALATVSYHRLVRKFLSNLCNRTKARHYCRYEERFTRYLGRPARVRFISGAGQVGARARVRYSVSERACVVITVKLGDRTVFERRRRQDGGRRSVSFPVRESGVYDVRIEVFDARGHTTVVRGSFTVP